MLDENLTVVASILFRTLTNVLPLYILAVPFPTVASILDRTKLAPFPTKRFRTRALRPFVIQLTLATVQAKLMAAILFASISRISGHTVAYDSVFRCKLRFTVFSADGYLAALSFMSRWAGADLAVVFHRADASVVAA